MQSCFDMYILSHGIVYYKIAWNNNIFHMSGLANLSIHYKGCMIIVAGIKGESGNYK